MIYLSPPQSEWLQLFNSEQVLIRAAIGDYIIDIQHIGSTSIPGIYAKPVIDIVIGIADLNQINNAVIKKIEALGYCYVKKYEDGMPYRRYFVKDNAEFKRTHQIHLIEITHEFWRRHLLFRDYLRAHPEEAKQYEALKQQLAQQYSDTNLYAMAKTEFCNEIHAKAITWANNK